jgi:drug/metabolite transporter (DMT)-like permease
LIFFGILFYTSIPTHQHLINTSSTPHQHHISMAIHTPPWVYGAVTIFTLFLWFNMPDRYRPMSYSPVAFAVALYASYPLTMFMFTVLMLLLLKHQVNPKPGQTRLMLSF